MSIIDKFKLKVDIPDRLFFRIGDVAELLGVKPHVLRYWETEFPMIQPQKSASGQRVYRRSDVETVCVIKHLLHNERYSIDGARKRLKQLKQLDTASVSDSGTDATEVAAETRTELRAGVGSGVGVGALAAFEGSLSPQLGAEKVAEVRKLVEEIQALASTISDLFGI